MHRIVVFDECGEPTHTCVVAEDSMVEAFLADNKQARYIPTGLSEDDALSSLHLVGGELRTRRPRPDWFWFWDSVTGDWEPRLALIKDKATTDVDATAEQTRLKYLTPGSGQAMEYEEVYRQAMEFISKPSGHYPMLQADVDAGLCETVEQAASTVIAMRQQWEQAGQAIRRIRLEAKRRIRESNDPAEIARIREEAVRDLASI